MQVVIETDRYGADRLAELAGELSGAKFDTREVHAQVGDPDTWMFIAQLAPAALATLSAAVVTLIRQRKIKYIKIDNREFRDITAEQFSEVMKQLKQPRE